MASYRETSVLKVVKKTHKVVFAKGIDEAKDILDQLANVPRYAVFNGIGTEYSDDGTFTSHVLIFKSETETKE